MKVVIQEGLHFNAKHYKVAVPEAFICDAPARAFLKCVKGHSGYNGCERCVQTGVYVSGRMTYPDLTAELRTDSQFEEMIDEDHHTGVSPINHLGVGLVTSFVLDYMHHVCLGVVRKLIYLLIKGPLKCRVSASVLSLISQLASLRLNILRPSPGNPDRCLKLPSGKPQNSDYFFCILDLLCCEIIYRIIYTDTLCCCL